MSEIFNHSFFFSPFDFLTHAMTESISQNGRQDVNRVLPLRVTGITARMERSGQFRLSSTQDHSLRCSRKDKINKDSSRPKIYAFVADEGQDTGTLPGSVRDSECCFKIREAAV